ncbi:MAG: stage II sporulation protein D [Clostridia bacterium]|nr:stage II sporulation protein D [Clostridia bacterium]
MKGTLTLAISIIFSMLVIPLSALPDNAKLTLPVQSTQNDLLYEKQEPQPAPQKIKVLLGDDVAEYEISDYVFGVVAAEMPALYHEEALKAQAVAAYTFALYKMDTNGDDKYDIAADPDKAQAFITREQAKNKWGEKAEEYIKKIDNCVSAVSGQILTYNNSPIFAAYHAISAGKTNSCADVWGKDLPYLKSRDSFGDKLCDGYLSEVTLSADELTKKLKKLTKATGEPKNYFSDISAADNGYVKSITYCGKKLTGAQISTALELRSSNFEVSLTDDSFTFKVKGYGHGVGLSQTGADYMAKQGSRYDEILLHYYKGATLQKN